MKTRRTLLIAALLGLLGAFVEPSWTRHVKDAVEHAFAGKALFHSQWTGVELVSDVGAWMSVAGWHVLIPVVVVASAAATTVALRLVLAATPARRAPDPRRPARSGRTTRTGRRTAHGKSRARHLATLEGRERAGVAPGAGSTRSAHNLEESLSSRDGRRELVLSGAGLGVTAAASGVFVYIYAADAVAAPAATLVGRLVYFLVVGVLLYGSLVYQLARLGYLRRLLRHRPASDEELESLRARTAPSTVILIPSYKEEPQVVWQTLLSACLQDYPNRRVVLLIDDPPSPRSREDVVALERARRLPARLAAILDPAARLFGQELERYLEGAAAGAVDPRREAARLAGLHEVAASWFRRRSDELGAETHTDRLVAREVLERPARTQEAHAAALRERAAGRGEPLSETELRRGYERLADLFRVEVTCFERKLFANLSHEPNKAMNLNSYIALLGRRFQVVGEGPDRRLLPASAGTEADLAVPPADYVVTLDADSLLRPEYVLRLIHEMERPGNERVAVAQTPYSAVPDAPGALERVAGATTDIQYIIHQGFTRHGATYWVGANALLRVTALRDIMSCERERERGLWVRKYIQDRTVIEDTESSVDLVDRDWTLFNYPARLAFSATPPDYGALVIQRRRWANGGLIILPKLLRYLAPGPWRPAKAAEGFLRVHYLLSIAAANVALLLLVVYPFGTGAAQVWLPIAALPYFTLYAHDLGRLGYRRLDVVRVYALNLLLVPVNLGGVGKSLQQALLRRRIPFGRTPKVSGRTAAQPLYVLAPCLMLLYCGFAAASDSVDGRWSHAAFDLLTASLLFYAVLRFIGARASWQDVTRPIARRRSRSSGQPATARRPSALSPSFEEA